jgi:large subunit ribosomal protein L21
MFAVIRTGAKQYKVEQGSIIEIERIEGPVGQSLEISDVLLVSSDGDIKIGQPVVEGASVTAEIVEQKRAKKVIIYKKLRRHGKRLKKGHRQELTRICVKSINA